MGSPWGCGFGLKSGEELKTSLSPKHHPGTGRAGVTELGMACGTPSPSRGNLGTGGRQDPTSSHPSPGKWRQAGRGGLALSLRELGTAGRSGCIPKELRAGRMRGSSSIPDCGIPLRLEKPFPSSWVLDPESAPPQPGRCDSSRPRDSQVLGAGSHPAFNSPLFPETSARVPLPLPLLRVPEAMLGRS